MQEDTTSTPEKSRRDTQVKKDLQKVKRDWQVREMPGDTVF